MTALEIPVDVKNAIDLVNPARGIIESRFDRNKEWKTLFEFYNKHNEKKLGMGCQPCFAKVVQWIKAKMLLELKHLATDVDGFNAACDKAMENAKAFKNENKIQTP